MRWLVLLLAVSCGPLPLKQPGQDIDVEFINDYGESLVSITVTQQPRGGATELDEKYGDPSVGARVVMSNERIKVWRSQVVYKAIPNANTQAQLMFGIEIVNLGQKYPFTVTTDFPGTLSGKKRIVFTYDFDWALGEVALTYVWR